MRIKTILGTQADEYHVASSNSRSTLNDRTTRQQNYSVETGDLIESAAPHLKGLPGIALPIEDARADMTLENAITTRHSIRSFAQTPISKAKLAKLLYLANGFRRGGNEVIAPEGGRNVPSAGGMGSVEIYCFIMMVEDIEPGIYHFDTCTHKLRLIKSGSFAEWLTTFTMLQAEFSEIAALLVLTGKVGRLREKYGLRSYRLALMDIGHVSQNIYLTATALGLGTCATAGFVDAEMNSVLELDGLDHCALLAHGIGVPSDEVRVEQG